MCSGWYYNRENSTCFGQFVYVIQVMLTVSCQHNLYDIYRCCVCAVKNS